MSAPIASVWFISAADEPNWAENADVKALPVASGKVDVDPLTPDCKQKFIWFHEWIN